MSKNSHNKYLKIRAARSRNDSILKPLRALHPVTFSHWGNPCNPLKIGISEDLRIQYPQISNKRLHQFLWVYTRTYRYLAAIALRVPRVDLDGKIVGMISDTEYEIAHNRGREKFQNWDDILAVEDRYRQNLLAQAAE
jgi:sRNA-binding protein